MHVHAAPRHTRIRVRFAAIAQAAGCALLRTLLSAAAGGSSVRGESAAVETSEAAALDVALAALEAHGEPSTEPEPLGGPTGASSKNGSFAESISADACEIVSLVAARRARAPLIARRPAVVPLVARALSIHGTHSAAVAQSACWALRGLCTRRDGGSSTARAGGEGSAAAERLATLRQHGGESAINRVLSSRGASLSRPLKACCQELLHALG